MNARKPKYDALFHGPRGNRIWAGLRYSTTPSFPGREQASAFRLKWRDEVHHQIHPRSSKGSATRPPRWRLAARHHRRARKVQRVLSTAVYRCEPTGGVVSPKRCTRAFAALVARL